MIEIGRDGKPKDPWQNTRFVYLVNPLSAEAYTFVTSSWGGRQAVNDLAEQNQVSMVSTRGTVMSADNKPTRGHSDLAVLCEPVARLVWGEPSRETKTELRWGSRGSRVLNREKGVWFDHENGIGGGTLKLVPGTTLKERLQWLRDRGLIIKKSDPPR